VCLLFFNKYGRNVDILFEKTDYSLKFATALSFKGILKLYEMTHVGLGKALLNEN
jgi:hypothetical protein